MDLVRGVSLDQLAVFISVVEAGSFSAAARRLNRSQPAVTYAIEKIEEILGLEIFDRGGYRPELTEAGRAILGRARSVVREMSLLGKQAQSLKGQVESEVCLTVDGMFPIAILMPIVERFRIEWPMTSLVIMVENLSASVENMQKSETTIGLLAAVVAARANFARKAMMTVDMVAVAATRHPLISGGHPIDYEELARHIQIVLTDRGGSDRDQEYGIVSPFSWRTSDLGAKHAMIIAGLGWGSLPLHVVEADIQAGRLVPLRVSEIGLLDRKLNFDLVWKSGSALGPAATWLRTALFEISDQVMDASGALAR